MPLIYLDFEVRRDYISQNLCINRTKPLLNCNGKCYLAKRLAAAQENEEREAERHFVFQLVEMVADPSKLYFSTHFPVLRKVIATNTLYSYTSHLLGRVMTSGIFRPPLAS